MTLFDIIVDPHYPDTVIPVDTTDTVVTASNVIGGNQQIADIAPHPSDFWGIVGDNLFLTIIVVLVALSLCFYFVRKYRKTNA